VALGTHGGVIRQRIYAGGSNDRRSGRRKNSSLGRGGQTHPSGHLGSHEVPEGWTGRLATGRLTAQQSEALRNLKLKPGEVHELTKK
jgi:hypothetical protein